MRSIPAVIATDAEDVAWALHTADALWKRQERIDAIVWLRRAAQAAGEAEDDDRALALARNAAELAEWIAQNPGVGPDVQGAPTPAPPAAGEAVDDLLRGPGDDDPTPVIDIAVTSEAPQSLPPVATPSRPPVPKSPRPAPRSPLPPVSQSTPPMRAHVPTAAEAHAGMLDPWGDPGASTRNRPAVPPPVRPAAPAAPPPPALESDEVVTSAPPVSIGTLEAAHVPVEAKSAAPPPRPPPRPGPPPAPSRAQPPPVRSDARPPEPHFPKPAPKAPPPKPPPRRPVEPPQAAPKAASQAQPAAALDAALDPALDSALQAAAEPAQAPSMPPEVTTVPPEALSEPPGAPSPDAMSEPPEAPAEPALAVPVEPEAAPAQPTPEPPAAAPPAPVASNGVDLSTVEALSDLPDDARDAFAAAAKVETLGREDEVSSFALALVLEGDVDVAATIVDAPAQRMGAGAVLRARGTIEQFAPMRLIGASATARVATWDEHAVTEAFRTCPWVEDDLRAAGDRLQALVGITMGPLGERLDPSLRADVMSRLELRTLAEHEVVTTRGAATVGLLVVGGGELEVLGDDGNPNGTVLGPGEFLFPSESLRAAPAPSTVRASTGGALVLHAERGVAQELLVTCPPLLEIFAGM
jgi:hypothetical protein